MYMNFENSYTGTPPFLVEIFWQREVPGLET